MDTETVRLLERAARKAASRCSSSAYGVTMGAFADELAAALDGDGPEEWEAAGCEVREQSGALIAGCFTAVDARRIARLPVLERAADAIVAEWDKERHRYLGGRADLYHALVAARNQEGQ